MRTGTERDEDRNREGWMRTETERYKDKNREV